MIGNSARGSAVGNNNEIVIGYNTISKGQATGYINAGGGGTFQGNNASAWSQTSDRRLKKNIVDNTVGLEKINQLQVRNFEYRTEDEVTELASTDVIDIQGIQLGVIAQEIQAVLPSCVTEQNTGVLSVNADNLTWYMINAIQELSTQLDAALARITTLEG